MLLLSCMKRPTLPPSLCYAEEIVPGCLDSTPYGAMPSNSCAGGLFVVVANSDNIGRGLEFRGGRFLRIDTSMERYGNGCAAFWT